MSTSTCSTVLWMLEISWPLGLLSSCLDSLGTSTMPSPSARFLSACGHLNKTQNNSKRHQPENRPCFQSMVGFALCFGADQRTVATNNQHLDRQGDGDQPAQRWSCRKLSCDQELIWVNCSDNLGLLWIYHDISIVFMGAINQGSDIFRDTNVEDIKEY